LNVFTPAVSLRLNSVVPLGAVVLLLQTKLMANNKLQWGCIMGQYFCSEIHPRQSKAKRSQPANPILYLAAVEVSAGTK
jgi:hypothetical protein